MSGPVPLAAYRRLLRRFGPQGWWPTTAGSARLPSYHPGRRRPLTERERAEVCVGAILTQNTNWGNVESALAALHDAGIRDLRRLARLDVRRLARLVRSSGYFRQKARKLKVFARRALSRGRLSAWLAGPLGPLREELLGLWGVGPETADSILLYAGGRPAFVVDAYTQRIGARLGWFKPGSYERVQGFFVRRLPASSALYAEFHALLVALAKRHCRATPECAGCPLRASCRHFLRGRGLGRA